MNFELINYLNFGWFFYDGKTNSVSITYDTKKDAINALCSNNIKLDKDLTTKGKKRVLKQQ